MGNRARAAREVLTRGMLRAERALDRYRRALLVLSWGLCAAAAATGWLAPPAGWVQNLAYRVVIIADLASIYLWIGVYSILQPWWTTRIGRSLVSKDAALSVPFLIFASSLLFHLTRLSSRVASGLDLGALAAVAVILAWRSDMWIAETGSGRRGTLPAREDDTPGTDSEEVT